MLLEAFACSIISLAEFTKTQHYKLEENTKEKILSDGLYHFTNKEVANKIVKDGYFRPTKGIIGNHFGKDKVYMFAGIPDMNNFAKNLPSNINPFVSGNLEFSAVKLNPNNEELSNFKERLQDSAVVYEGRYDIGENRARAVELVIDLDKEGKCIFREKTEEELQNGYKPSEALIEYIEGHKIGKGANELKVFYKEVKAGLQSIPNAIPRFYRDFKSKREKKKEIKEFQPYSVELKTLDGNGENSYSINCDKLEFYGDKKLSRIKIDKEISRTGEKVSYECYADEHILNLGDQAAAQYLKNIEYAIANKLLNKANDIYYAGQPMYDIKTGKVVIGVDEKFNNLLQERNIAKFFGDINEKSNELLNKKIKEYYRKHPIRKFLDNRKIKNGEIKMLADKYDIGKYTNNKLESFSLDDAYNDVENHNGFELNKKCDFEYKEGSKFSVLIGENVEIDGKQLTKLMIGEENYLNKTLDDTVKSLQNYYVESTVFENVDKKDLAKYFSELQYMSDENALNIEENGFVGKYVGGIELNKKGKISNKTYDNNLFEKYGKEIHIDNKKEKFDLSHLICDEKEQTKNYVRQNDDRVVESKENEKIK